MANKKLLKKNVNMGKDEKGKIKYATVYGYSQKELDQKVRAKLLERDHGKVVSNESFSYWSNEWLERKEKKLKAGAIKPDTFYQYKRAVDVLNKELGDLNFREIRKGYFERYINDVYSKQPCGTGKPPARRTVNNVVQVAKWVTENAEANGCPGCTKFYDIDIFTDKKKVVGSLNEDQINKIIELDHPMQPCCMLMLFAGLRRGEAIALTWNDIDFDREIIKVSNSVYFEDNQPILQSGGKTRAASREVPMPPVLSNYLREYRTTKEPTSVLVAPSLSGGLYTRTSFRKAWDSYMNAFDKAYGVLEYSKTKKGKDDHRKNPLVVVPGIEPFNPHACRHTFATMLFWENIPEVKAMQILGHSSISVTINIYTDLRRSYISLPKSFKAKLQNEYKVRVA